MKAYSRRCFTLRRLKCADLAGLVSVYLRPTGILPVGRRYTRRIRNRSTE